jgi:hypothetical protein
MYGLLEVQNDHYADQFPLYLPPFHFRSRGKLNKVR